MCAEPSFACLKFEKRLTVFHLHGEFMGTFILTRFPYNHCQASVRATALIGNPVERWQQLCNLRDRVVRRHGQANMPKNIGNRLCWPDELSSLNVRFGS